MPRSSVALTPTPLSGDAVMTAAEAVRSQKLGADVEAFEARVLDEGAVLQIVAGDDVVLSVLRPRLLPRLDEVERLLPGTLAPEATQWWTDAYTPRQPAASSFTRGSPPNALRADDPSAVSLLRVRPRAGALRGRPADPRAEPA